MYKSDLKKFSIYLFIIHVVKHYTKNSRREAYLNILKFFFQIIFT